MQTLSQKGRTLWPVWVLGLLIFITCADLFTGMTRSAVSSNLLGTVPVLAFVAFGIFWIQSRHDLLIPILMLSGLIVSWFAASWLGVQSPISLGMTAASFGLGIALFTVLRQNSESEALLDHHKEEAPLSQELEESLQSPIHNIEEADFEEELDKGEVLQTWKRVRQSDGSECITGTLTVHFDPGERIRHCHVPVSPAFQSLPEGWCESSHPEIRVELSMLQTYGVRVSARRSVNSFDAVTAEISMVLVAAESSRFAA